MSGELAGKSVVPPRRPPLASFHTNQSGVEHARPGVRRRGGGDTVNMIMIEKRGHESALSACPAPAAAFAAAPARLRAVSGYRLLAAITPFQGTGLPVAAQLVQLVNDVSTMFVQLRPGDTARRPPA
jgi:hypothetical protein